MILAHTFGAGGPDVEFLVLAFALVILAIVLFIQKTAKPAVPVVLLVVAVGFGIGAFAVGGSPASVSSEGISVAIEAPEDGATVAAGEPVKLNIKLTGGTIVTGASEDPNAGHFHLYVDGEIIEMPTTNTPDVELDEGTHTVTIEFTDAQHAPLSPRVLDEVELTAE
jgi:hypothetical protein